MVSRLRSWSFARILISLDCRCCCCCARATACCLSHALGRCMLSRRRTFLLPTSLLEHPHNGHHTLSYTSCDCDTSHQSVSWDEPPTVGPAPCARSGHSFTAVGGKFLLFGGNGRLDGALLGTQRLGVCDFEGRHMVACLCASSLWREGQRRGAQLGTHALHALQCNCAAAPACAQKPTPLPPVHTRMNIIQNTTQARRRPSTTSTSSTRAAPTSTSGGRSPAPRQGPPRARATWRSR